LIAEELKKGDEGIAVEILLSGQNVDVKFLDELVSGYSEDKDALRLMEAIADHEKVGKKTLAILIRDISSTLSSDIDSAVASKVLANPKVDSDFLYRIVILMETRKFEDLLRNLVEHPISESKTFFYDHLMNLISLARSKGSPVAVEETLMVLLKDARTPYNVLKYILRHYEQAYYCNNEKNEEFDMYQAIMDNPKIFEYPDLLRLSIKQSSVTGLKLQKEFGWRLLAEACPASLAVAESVVFLLDDNFTFPDERQMDGIAEKFKAFPEIFNRAISIISKK